MHCRSPCQLIKSKTKHSSRFLVENIVGGFRLNQVPPLENFLTLFFYWNGSSPKKAKAVRCATGEGVNGYTKINTKVLVSRYLSKPFKYSRKRYKIMQKFQRGDESPLISVLEEFRRDTSKFSEKSSCILLGHVLLYPCQVKDARVQRNQSPEKNLKKFLTN